MAAGRRALIVATGEYEHEGLARLLSPGADADALAGVLADPQIGGFDVEVVRDQPAHDVQAKIEDLFSEAHPDDLLILHFSCHGLKSEAGELFFAARNTRPNRLASSAISADFVQRCVRSSRSRSIVLFLDCCYGGAFGQGVAVRAAGDVNVLDSFPTGRLGGGRGRAVISASNAVEYAFEGEALVEGEQIAPSRFTAALVQGLATGEADRDQDGWVSLNELYDYVFDTVREVSPNQTPSRDIEMQGELYLARSTRKVIRPGPVPAELRAAAADPNMFSRAGAVAELRTRLLADNLPVAVGAYQLLTTIAVEDIAYVAQQARAALDEARLVLSESPVRFGQVIQGTDVVRRVTLSGPPIALAVTATATTADARLRLTPGDGSIEVALDTQVVGPFAGAIVFTGPTGETVVPVDADVVAATVGRSGRFGRSSKASQAVTPVISPAATNPAAVSPAAANPTAVSPADLKVAVPRPVEPHSPTERRGPVIGLPRVLILVGLVIMLASLTTTWFNGSLRLTDLDWNNSTNGTFLPQVWGTLAVGILAAAGLVTGLWPAVTLGLAGVTGFSAFWISAFAAAAPSAVQAGDFVYGLGGLVISVGVALWARQLLATSPRPQRESRRPLVLAGSALIVVAEVLLIGGDSLPLSLAYFAVVMALSAVVLAPRLVDDSVRIATLTGFTVNGLLAIGSVINYLARDGDDGAKLTDGTGRLALEAVVAVGMWVALGRVPDPAAKGQQAS